MRFVAEEIQSQPQVWREAAERARSSLASLPVPGTRVAFFGCGTSFYVAQAVAALRESCGCGESDAFAASEFPGRRRYDLAVALSRSGTTTEVLSVAESLRGVVPVLAVTADGDGPLAGLAARVVAMPFADEQSVVQTRFATATLALFRAGFGEDVGGFVRDGERALTCDLPGVEGVRQLVFLGSGWRIGLAHEAALKVREAAQAWSEAYPAMEYRHGPISVAEEGTVVWALDSLPDGLAAQIRATGATLVCGALDPMAELVRVQRFAVALAAARGLDPDQPRALTRSVVLEGAGHGR